MSIGRFRDVPSEMDGVEREIAAAQYPEGGLVFGLASGVVAGMLTSALLLVTLPFVGALAGFAVGRQYRTYRLRQRRRSRESGE
ncbi:hypothetical protein [Natrialba hulunbeirensis]|nr:hypothetical protein [Natrialba hulunbeirensis]